MRRSIRLGISITIALAAASIIAVSSAIARTTMEDGGGLKSTGGEGTRRSIYEEMRRLSAAERARLRAAAEVPLDDQAIDAEGAAPVLMERFSRAHAFTLLIDHVADLMRRGLLDGHRAARVHRDLVEAFERDDALGEDHEACVRVSDVLRAIIVIVSDTHFAGGPSTLGRTPSPFAASLGCR